MMIRSAPAASAHLAEIPVPAPAPRMRVPRALFALHRSRHAARSIMLSPCADLAYEGTTRNIQYFSRRCLVVGATSDRYRPAIRRVGLDRFMGSGSRAGKTEAGVNGYQQYREPDSDRYHVGANCHVARSGYGFLRFLRATSRNERITGFSCCG